MNALPPLSLDGKNGQREVDPVQAVVVDTHLPSPAGDAAIRCAIYAQCARCIQADPNPLAAQIGACEAYAGEQGWETVAVYKDVAVSARKDSRPGLNQMVAAMDRNAFDVLLVENVSQLSLDYPHLHALFEDVEAAGVAIHTIGGPGAISAMELLFRNAMTRSFRNEAAARKRLRQNLTLRSSREPAARKRVAS